MRPPASIRDHLPLVLAAALLFLLGAGLYMGAFRYGGEPFIYGDSGDGFFNLWVMEHVREALPRGPEALADGRMFWPRGEDSFWWSDNLLLPACLHAITRQLAPDIVRAYWWTSMLMTLGGYLAFLFLFGVIHAGVARDRPGVPGWTPWLVPLFAFLAAFSSSRLLFVSHFQNLASLWLILLIGGMLGYARFGRREFFTIMVASEVALIFSAMYFAVTGACLILVWVLFELLAGPRRVGALLRRRVLLLLAAGVVVAPLVMAYAGVERITYEPGYIRSLAMEFAEVYTPHSGLGRQLLERAVTEPKAVNYESPAYLGAGLILALIGVAAMTVPVAWRRVKGWLRHPLFWGLIVLAVLFDGGPRDWRGAMSWGALLLTGFLFVLAAWLARGAARDRSMGYMLVLLAAFACVAYGIADGPESRFVEQSVNGSVWGLFAAVVPGVAHMRAVGRLAAVAQPLMMGLALAGILVMLARVTGRRRTWLSALGAVLVVLQLADQQGSETLTETVDPAVITPTYEERQALDALEGSAVFFPATPFHGNTLPMLYAAGAQGLTLMNGYSARSTPLWDSVMAAGWRASEPTGDQLNLAEAEGVDYLLLRKDRLRGKRIKAIRAKHPVIFENERLLILRAGQPVSTRDAAHEFSGSVSHDAFGIPIVEGAAFAATWWTGGCTGERYSQLFSTGCNTPGCYA